MTSGIKNKSRPIEVADIDIAVRMLQQHIDDPGIDPLIEALQTLRTAPQDPAHQAQVIAAFDGLNILQGAALTYAPYLNIFVSDDPFGDEPAR